MLRRLALASAALVLAASTAGCGESGPGPPSEDVKGAIVFAYGDAVSPDSGDEGFTDEIRSMNADGSQRRTIARGQTQDLWVASPAWSPDGKTIVYSRLVNRPNGNLAIQLFVMNADGSGQRRLSRHGSEDYDDPAWSPDGSQIAFFRYPAARYGHEHTDLYLMNADGSGERRLARLTPDLYTTTGFPEWSPDGKITYQGERGIYSIDADGSGKRHLSGTGLADGSLSWSPDGRRLAFTRAVDGSDEVNVMNADGTAQHPVAHLEDAEVHGIDWSPDGSWIAFGASPITIGYGRSDIYIVKPDGSDLARLTTSGWNDQPAWRPTRLLR